MSQDPDPIPDQADVFNIDIGKLLRARRNELGVTQSEIARHLGVSQQQIGKYEKGIGRIPADNLRALCLWLKIDPGAVFLPQGLIEKSHFAGFAEDAAPYDTGGGAVKDDTVKLVGAFETITDARVRATILDMVEAMAASTAAIPPGARKGR